MAFSLTNRVATFFSLKKILFIYIFLVSRLWDLRIHARSSIHPSVLDDFIRKPFFRFSEILFGLSDQKVRKNVPRACLIIFPILAYNCLKLPQNAQNGCFCIFIIMHSLECSFFVCFKPILWSLDSNWSIFDHIWLYRYWSTGNVFCFNCCFQNQKNNNSGKKNSNYDSPLLTFLKWRFFAFFFHFFIWNMVCIVEVAIEIFAFLPFSNCPDFYQQNVILGRKWVKIIVYWNFS